MENGECSPCRAEIEYLDFAPTSPTNCEACPHQANCFGGDEIGPKAGYWRSSADSMNFLECFNQGACNGRQSLDDSPTGQC